ncbi:MAG: hypothetical protein ACMZ7B_09850 [Balneola sp.]
MEFRISFSWRIFMYIAAPLLGVLGVWPFFLINSSIAKNGFWVALVILLLSTGFIAGCIYSFLRINREKIVFKNGKLVHHLAFSRKELSFDHIKGYRTDGNYIHIIPKDEKKKALRISSYIENRDFFLSQLYQKFENLDTNESRDELNEFLSNKRYGADKVEREKRLFLAKKTTNVFNTITFVLAAWLLLYPRPYILIVLLNILIPIVALFFFYSFKGLIKLDKSKESIYPNIASPLIIPGMILALRCLFDFSILSFNNFWVPAILSSTVFFGLFFISSEELKKTNSISLIRTISLFLFLSMYVSTSLLMLNRLFDFERPSAYQALVIKKNKPSEGNDYKLVLADGWDPRINSTESPIVSEEFFNRTNVGDSVYVNVHEGAFKIPWYYIDEYRLTRSSIKKLNFEYYIDTTLFKLN